jgi:hypothetical protein
VTLLSRSTNAKSKALRVSGIAAAIVWTVLALRERSAWPVSGLVALALCALAALAHRGVPEAAVRAVMAVPWRTFVAACAIAAAATSWWMVHAILRDTPLSIDAAVYLAQARALGHLHFGIPAPRPMQAFSNHFFSEGPDRLLYGVFPPGWPLVIVPLLALGAPMLVGPAVAAALVVAQAALGRSVGRLAGDGADGELGARVAILLSLPSIGRALETADLLSHALVAVLAAFAVAFALDARREGGATAGKAVAIGACVGLAIAARLLDGVILGVAVVAAGWRARSLKGVAWATLGAAPWLVLLAVEQRCATGAWLMPTQSEYFARSDWPPHCHRLGLGVDVGCTVEHRGIVAHYGPAGYDFHQALKIIRERAGKVGEDLLSFAPLALFAFVPVAVGASAVDALLVAFVLAFTFFYALFYYGNSQFFGARHLFPVAPFLWLLVGRAFRWVPHRGSGARVWLDASHARAAGAFGVVALAFAASRGPWKAGLHEAHEYQDTRSDLRRMLAGHGIDRAIVKTIDEIAVATAFDPWQDGDDRLFVVDDGSGVVELRRAHPDLPVLLGLSMDDIGRLYARPPAPGVFVELERSWPTFVLPDGLGACRGRRKEASGGAVLQLAHAHPGSSISVPFETALTGDYALRVDALVGPSFGDYALTLDGEPLPPYHGYAPEREPRKGEAIEHALAVGRHVLVATCTGKDGRSTAYDADLDALVGDPVIAPAPR